MDFARTPGFSLSPARQSTPRLQRRFPSKGDGDGPQKSSNFIVTPGGTCNAMASHCKNPFACSQFSKTEHAVFVLESLEQMWKDEVACDFLIKVEGELFPVHKALLVASSDYFRAMIVSSMKEGKEGFAEMKGIAASAVKHCLEYIYTGRTILTKDNVVDVLQAASILQLGKLLKVCYDFLKENINFESCVLTLQTAQLYDHQELENLSCEFFTTHFSQVTISSSFCELTKDDALRYILEFGPNDEIKWQASKRWIEQEVAIRDEEVNEFFNMLDLADFPSSLLLKNTWGTEYFRNCDTCLNRMYHRVFSNVLELSENISISNCFILNEMAKSYQHTVDEIHGIIFKFMLEKFVKLASMKEFEALPEADVVDLLQSPHAVYFSSEKVKWNAALKWIKAKPKERAKVFKTLVKTISFEKLPQDFVQESVRKESLVQKFPECQKILLDAAFSKTPQDLNENFLAILDSNNGLNILALNEKKWHPLHFSPVTQKVKITSFNGYLCLLDGKQLRIAKGGKWWQMAALSKEPSNEAQMIPFKDCIYVLEKTRKTFCYYDSLLDSWSEDISLEAGLSVNTVVQPAENTVLLLNIQTLDFHPVMHKDELEVFQRVSLPSSINIGLDRHSSSAYCNGSVFVCGSQSQNCSVAKYNLVTKEWKKITSPNQLNQGKRVKLGIVDKKLISYVTGTTSELLVEFYDDKLDEWVLLRNAPRFKSRGFCKTVTSICSFHDAKF